VVFRNKESPCRGFEVSGRRALLGNSCSYLIPEGTEKEVTFRGPDTCTIRCPVRPYTRGFICVVDTPYFAVTDGTGRFAIPGVPAGEYQVAVWHEGVGNVKGAGATEVTVGQAREHVLNFRVSVPKDAGK